MKILFLTEFFPTELGGKLSGGSEARTYYLAVEIAKQGHKVLVVTARLSGTQKYESWSGVEIYRVGPQRSYVKGTDLFTRILFWLAMVWKSLWLDFDIVDGNNTAVYVAASVVSRLKGKKCVFWIPDLLSFAKWQASVGTIAAIINTFNQWLSLKSPGVGVIALSRYTQKLIPQKSKVIYPGVVNLAKRKSILRWPPIIVSIQRLARYKRTDLVIKAVALLKKRGIIVNYHIVGTGEEEKSLTRLIKKLKLTRQAKLLGNLSHPEVMRELSRADLFSLPSEIEGFGIVTLEAMGFGLPFVNSNLPVHEEIREISQAGLLFESGDAKDLANKIEYLIKNRGEYQKFSQNAFTFAKKHTWAKVAKETEKIYLPLL